jgi:lysyl-tRNA synthetase class 2
VSGSAPAWRPDRFEQRLPFLAARARILKAVRAWFEAEGFLEVETPALQVSPGMEPNLDVFETALRDGFGGGMPMSLHTSPEFGMKKLLAAGAGPIFQIAHVFRNGERSATHHPEFSMLEWYRPGAGWREGVADTLALIRVALSAASPLAPAGTFKTDEDVEWLSVRAAFERNLGFDPMPMQSDTDALRTFTEAAGITTSPDDGWDDIFFRCLLNRIEPGLGEEMPVVLHGYPARMAALARLDPSDPLVAERFEVFAGGFELANGFGELTDAAEQRRRFENDQAQIRAAGRDRGIDEDFLAALEHGLPEAVGIAMGFDRLVMLATGAQRIDDVLWLPVAAPP